MVSACLREKHDNYYVIISYYEEGKRKQIWEPTGLKVRGNKRKAEQILAEYQKRYNIEERRLIGEGEMVKDCSSAKCLEVRTNDILFG